MSFEIPASTIASLFGGLVVGLILHFARMYTTRRDRDEERAIAHATFSGTVNAQMDGINGRLDSIDERLSELPCMGCTPAPPTAAPAKARLVNG